MIRIEEWTVPSPEQMMLTIQGMRNPMDSWNKSDSYIIYDCPGDCESCDYDACKNDLNNVDGFVLGVNDHNLMKSLAKAGSDHRKFMRMMPVHIRITAPLYWWKEFDTYRTGVAPNPTDIEMNSCSTMHKIHKKELTLDDFSHEHLTTRSLDILLRTIKYLNECRDLYIN